MGLGLGPNAGAAYTGGLPPAWSGGWVSTHPRGLGTPGGHLRGGRVEEQWSLQGQGGGKGGWGRRGRCPRARLDPPALPPLQHRHLPLSTTSSSSAAPPPLLPPPEETSPPSPRLSPVFLRPHLPCQPCGGDCQGPGVPGPRGAAPVVGVQVVQPPTEQAALPVCECLNLFLYGLAHLSLPLCTDWHTCHLLTM